MSVLLRLLVLMIAFLSAANAAEPPTFPNNEDMRHIRTINGPQLSPDGQSVLVRIVESTVDGAKSHLWLVNIAQNTFRQLTYSPDADKAGELAGVWMPDGNSILFLAHRGEHTQLFRLPTNGGEAKAYDLKIVPAADDSKLADAIPPAKTDSPGEAKVEAKAEPLPDDVASFQVSPDGKTIAFLAKDPKTPGEKKQSDAKADATWVDHETHGTRLYLLDSESSKITPVSIPPDVQRVTWKPDSGMLLAIAEEPNSASDLKPCNTVWSVNVSDPSHPEKIPEFPATISNATWSADGNSIAFLTQAEHDAPPGYRDLFTFNFSSRAVRNLTNDFGGSISSQELFTLPGGSILAGANQGFDAMLLRLPARQLVHFPTPVAGSFQTNATHTGWVFLGSGPTQPVTLFYTADFSQTARSLNTPSLMPVNNRTVPSKRIEWKSDSFTIHGLLYLPPQAADHKVPLIVQVHGGPLGAYVDGFDPFVSFLIGHGWAVLRTNPRGSTSYGAAFAAANKNDLGGGDYRDIMAGLDFVLKTEPIDPARLALEGYSYGGEMAGFVEGKTSRFKAIISGAPVIDQYSEYGTESGSYYDRWYFGKPWEHPADAWRQSPLAGVGHATTPFLLLQGESDTTDPLGQAQEMYRALRQMGLLAVDLITYPREDHGPLARSMYGMPSTEPWHGFDARQRIVGFLEKAFR
jgi:dipeptidyl aminopeptidase/acylaminoacyl peptidase